MIQSGIFKAGRYKSDWNLDKGSGSRNYDKFITFEKSFPSKPLIVINICGLDTSKDRNTRVAIEAKDITNEGFSIQFFTWADSIIYALNASWIAYFNE